MDFTGACALSDTLDIASAFRLHTRADICTDGAVIFGGHLSIQIWSMRGDGLAI